MKKTPFFGLRVLLIALCTLCSCEVENLGLYIYPQSQPHELNSTPVILSQPPSVPAEVFEVVGYLPRYQISNVDPSVARHLTDLVYFTLWPEYDGTFTKDALAPSHLAFLRTVKKVYGVRVLIGIADHTRSGPLHVISNSESLRKKFSQGLADYLSSMQFEGADLDWEYPAEADLSAYTALLQNLKNDFAPKGLKLTIAVSPSEPLERAAYDAADRVHGMMYDDYGQHSTLANSAVHVQEMLDQGVPKEKLQLGVPFYGRGYTEKGPSWDSALSYKSLQGRFSPSPRQDTVSGYYFNGIDTIRQKVRYAKITGLSGVMIWEIGLDTNDGTSLLNAISDVRKTFN